MRKFINLFLGLTFMTVPSATMAQKNIMEAFDKIIKCKDAQITESHNLDKVPGTNVKTGQSDVYRFELPAKKINLVKNVISAFDKDKDLAYSINQGKALPDDREILLAVGDSETNNVEINSPDSEYIYSLFMAPQSEDPDGHYRYAYGMNYKWVDGKIVGKLVVTYAQTLDYRQQTQVKKQYSILSTITTNSSGINNTRVIQFNDSKASWFDTMMSYLQGMTTANSQTRIALATKAYKLIEEIGSYPDVTGPEIYTIREILNGMLDDKKYSETVLYQLLNRCFVLIDLKARPYFDQSFLESDSSLSLRLGIC